MKILLTGTHFTVAQAVIEEFRAYPKVELVYVGRATTLEGDPTPSQESLELPKMGIKFIPITAGRLQRSFTLYTIPSLLKIPVGFLEAFFIVLKEKPSVVLSFGGYIGMPLVFWTWMFSIPVIIHEQTLVSGLANKITGFFADKIAVSFPGDYEFPKEKVILTGNPIRKEILQSAKLLHFPSGTHKRLTILVTGGNQGSHIMNLAVEQCLDELTKIANVIHQTGDSKFKDFERLEFKQNENYKVFKWISDMGKVLGNVDLEVGRAGINTLTEVAYLGIPTLVIPIPYLFADEQNKNAKYFEKLGLVRILPQNKLNGQNLLKEIKSCINDLNHFKQQAKKAREVIIPNAAKKLALETIILAKR